MCIAHIFHGSFVVNLHIFHGSFVFWLDRKRLVAWKEKAGRKPMLLLGARQVGKTWLLQEFGARYYERVAYIRFDREPRMCEAFAQDYDMQRLRTAIEIHVGHKLEAGKTLLILDEIQECPAALTSLKYFCEELPQLHVAAAGSLLGLYEHHGTGFPVGKVNIYHLYPMNYLEFALLKITVDK